MYHCRKEKGLSAVEARGDSAITSLQVQGVTVIGALWDGQTRCRHFHTELDVIALKFACCDTYYPCHACHAEVADHPAVVWPRSRFAQPAVLCGVCGHELSVYEYLSADSICPHCMAQFNPGCKAHLHLYFAMDETGR